LIPATASAMTWIGDLVGVLSGVRRAKGLGAHGGVSLQEPCV
jgi:hypothetical protein